MLDKNKITKIHVFDFDNTLLETPLKPEKWTKGWYGKSLSLLPPYMPSIDKIPTEGMHLLNNKVYNEYINSIKSGDTFVVFMTGRHMGLRSLVLKILKAYGINPEEKDNQRAIFVSGAKTLPFKLSSIKNMVIEFPNVTNVEIWDDRLEHIEEFRKYEKDLKEIRNTINVIVFEPPNW